MGYYTNYYLEVIEGDKQVEDILELFGEDMNLPFDEYGNSSFECKWYEYREDMIKLSKIYPNCVLKLKGVGEESGDIWYEYFKNGKYQHCPAKITFDEYDEDKLEDTVV